MANLYMAWENEDIEYEFYANRNRVLRDSKAKAQEDLNRTGAGLDDTSVILSDPQAILDHSVDVKFFLQNETPVRARSWLNTFLKRYWVEPGYVTYEYSLPMPPGSANPGMTRHRVPLDEDFRPTTRPAPLERVVGITFVLTVPLPSRFGEKYDPRNRPESTPIPLKPGYRKQLRKTRKANHSPAPKAKQSTKTTPAKTVCKALWFLDP